MENNLDLTELLDYIDPRDCDYTEWLNVGMALKESGYACSVWEEWSRRDPGRYHAGETFRKWDSFKGTSVPVTGGTLVQMAKDRGWNPGDGGHELDWNDEIGGRDDHVVVQKGWIESQDFKEPGEDWKPEEQLITYLDVLFNEDENVGYVTEVWEKDDRLLPTSGSYDRTAGQLKAELRKCKGDLGAVLGDYNKAAGAWIRFNPLDGKGVRNDNVTDLRYALVESDETDLGQQNAILRELELPIAALVYSGKKSLHAIVHIGAPNYEEYRKRVEFLYDICRKNGLKPDKQNKNPSRLSRMPGIIRGEHKQFLLDTNIGKKNWDEWREWIEGVNDNLPDPESLTETWDNIPPLSTPLIDGVLRSGHKMLISGPSKAGKSFALIELVIAIAEGKTWLQHFPCTQGRVLYVNLELDRVSCLHRFRDVYTALKWAPRNIANIDIWNLRGQAIPMNKLAPKLIRRAAKRNYTAIIIDPIYKVLTGDENSADQMAAFCNQFDRVCHELGAAVIYCHHHSKGYQGQKRSVDRASGSGVFARDPDAILDMTQLVVSDTLANYIDDEGAAHVRTAWRIEGTLREFAAFEPV
ncbi:MAG: AAA family ATPase, partial [Clostridia bacterium]|nr:AAA family ATPase [Clostridia bacterium]